jgi:hypothetical protein
MDTVNLLLKTPWKLLPRFQLTIFIHLDTFSDIALGAAAAAADYFTGTGHYEHVQAYKGRRFLRIRYQRKNPLQL